MEASNPRRMEVMAAPRKYPDELRERAIRLALDLVEGPEKLSVNAACKGVGEQLGIVPDSLRNWVQQARIDAGNGPGLTTDARAARKGASALGQRGGCRPGPHSALGLTVGDAGWAPPQSASSRRGRAMGVDVTAHGAGPLGRGSHARSHGAVVVRYQRHDYRGAALWRLSLPMSASPAPDGTGALEPAVSHASATSSERSALRRASRRRAQWGC